MKKIVLILTCTLLSACADSVRLGYTDNIGIFYNNHPKDCQQLGMVLLSSGIWTSDLNSEIERLREATKEMGGNYTDIQNYDYQAGLSNLNTNHITGIVYHCPAKK